MYYLIMNKTSHIIYIMAKLKDISEYLEKNDNFLITCHESPDGDALSAEYALAKGLSLKNKFIKILNSDATPDKFMFIDTDHLISHYLNEKDIPVDIGKWTLIIVDTEKSNIGSLKDLLFDKVKNTLIIDHHTFDEPDSPFIYSNPEAGSSCEIIFELLMLLKVKIDLDTAIALYTGIVYDTGSFSYPKTSAQTFHIAEQLVRIGVIPNKIFSQLHESKTIESVILQTLVNQNMKLHFNQNVAVQYMSKKTLLDSGAKYEEAQEIVNFPLQSKKVKVSVFFKENSEGLLRCSIRSKGRVNCVKIAKGFNGGGHKTAAGFKCYDSFDIILKRVLDILEDYFT